ncbi:phosphotransferase family protein [Nocardia sp. SC052]|uniref:phosphotransferase family protein n=1 Tax=Nocardia sichangensis TaxID=3385975 RepID=UPI00399FB7B2
MAVARRHGVTVTAPEVLKDVSNVVIHLRPAPFVARVTTTTLLRPNLPSWLRREVAVVRYLADHGGAVVPPSDELPPGPHRHEGMWLTCWQYIEHDPEYVPGVAELTDSLAELHRVLRGYPGDLPYMGVVLDEIPTMIDTLERLKIVPAHLIVAFRAEFRRLAPILMADRETAQPLHGDAHAANVLATVNGLLWNDFEDTCAGPAKWDYATVLHRYQQWKPVLGELHPYCAARSLEGCVWTLLLAHRFPDQQHVADTYLDRWRRSITQGP